MRNSNTVCIGVNGIMVLLSCVVLIKKLWELVNFLAESHMTSLTCWKQGK